jgi:uncharacterized protein YjbI with pentapeptide repeats
VANEEHLAILKRGRRAWNTWRNEHASLKPDLAGADLCGIDIRGVHLHEADLRDALLAGADLGGGRLDGADLRGANLAGIRLRAADLSGANLNGTYLRGADLRETGLGGAHLSWADLAWAHLSGADLRGANLHAAHLYGVDLIGVDLGGADLSETYLRGAHFGGADLRGADLTSAKLNQTVLANVDLGSCRGLESCEHRGPSVVDHRTLQRSGPLPRAFLRGVGLPENLIDYLPSLLNQPIQWYSCFISYSSRDEAFAQRLHTDLQEKGVRCWFAPHDLPIGAKILDAIDEAIHLRDKLLLVLSEHAIASDWVEDEVTKAFEEERERAQAVLFPIRLDDVVFETREAWAGKLRANRNIGDFRHWKEHDAYQKALDRLLRDLRVEKA